MEKNLKFGSLLDIYGGLLTEKQAEALDYYYNEDYSLAEISELMDITRQGARDFIKRGEAVLLEADGRLGLSERFAALDRVRSLASGIIASEGRPDAAGNIRSLAEEIIAAADYVQNGEK